MLSTFFRRVLDAAVEDGAIGRGDLDVVRSLTEQGVTLEQSLVGTGLVDAKTYGSWLSRVSGFPVADVLPDEITDRSGLDDEIINQGVLPILITKKAAEIAFIQPDPALVDMVEKSVLHGSKEFRPSVMLIAEFRKRRPISDTVMHPIRTIKRLFREADQRGAHHIRLLPSEKGFHAFFDSKSDSDEAFSIPMNHVSAIRMRLSRLGSKSGWHAEPSRSGVEPVIRLVRRSGSGSHPLEWLSDADDRSGLTVFVAPDAFTVRHLIGRIRAYEPEGHWTDGTTQAYDADDQDGQELAVHAALSGRSAVAVASKDGDWYQPARESGIPVRIIRGYKTAHGIAWEVVR
ncbi:hypothetical protein IT407_03375 [Candidatus Uhrbacteria bacterium]|nr:hypothetical protein [Candidatus Uhrbacteria bacterium]